MVTEEVATSSCPTPMSGADAKRDGIPQLALLSDCLLVELTEPTRVLPSGIVLPETAVENHEEGVVRGYGDGIETDRTDLRNVPGWVIGGERIYFQKHHFESLEWVPGFGKRWGIVRERDVVAYETPEGGLAPHNDWLMLERCAASATVGSIILPQTARKPPRSGVLRDFGYGMAVTRGELSGCRLPVPAMIGKLGDWDFQCGVKVYWEHNAKRVVIAGRDGSDPYVFIRARDALAFEPVPSGAGD